jgi:putative MATE family efflux protein
VTRAVPGDPTAHDPAPEPDAPTPPKGQAGKFTEGSTLRHVLIMTATGSVGLMAIFIVDLLNLFYISLLGQQELAAAIGYAGTILFVATSVGIGVSIGISALVSRAIGARDRERARHLSASGLVLMAIAMALLSLVFLLLMDPTLRLLGAAGETKRLAERYLAITLPSNVFLGVGMACSGILRSVGDARRAMWVTLAGGLVAAVVDPILIFAMGLGLDGAAWATNLSRVTLTVVGLHGAVRIHDLVARPSMKRCWTDAATLSTIAGPAVLTNLATPVGNGYVTAALAPHGDAAVAAWAIIGRIIPVAFGAIFALSGSIGPIIGQNLGARRFDRVRGVINDSMLLIIGYVLVLWALLALSQDGVVAMFAATGEAASLLRFYCTVVAGTFLFFGMLFVANAAFNTLGFPLLATLFNWGRATLGIIPFAMIGGQWYGAHGVLLGQGIGGVLFGVGAAAMAYWAVRRIERSGKA